MPTQSVVLVVELNKLQHQIHAKGRLQTGNNDFDVAFLTQLRNIGGVDEVLWLHKHSFAITIDALYIREWPRIEKEAYRIVYARLGWNTSRVKVLRQNEKGEQIGSEKFVQIIPRQTHAHLIVEQAEEITAMAAHQSE